MTQRTELIPDLDVYDPDVYERGVPHADFARLRKEAPMYFHPESGVVLGGERGTGFWAITKYDDIVAISRNPGLFSSWKGGTNVPDYDDFDLDNIRMLMVNMDPPDHTKFRGMVRKGFTPRRVQAMKDGVVERIVEILDQAPVGEDFDFVRTVAAEVPLQIIAEIMGVPQSDCSMVFDWSNRLIGFDDPEFQTCMEDAREAAAEMWMYANGLAEERRGKDGDDLISLLVNAEVDGRQLDEMEFDAFFLMLAVAGNETTRNAMSGGLLALTEHPEQMKLLWENPEHIDTAVEEILRWVTPVMHFRRTATADTVLRGAHIKEGDKVALFYPSGNRDEEQFERAHEFDITRDPNFHLAFGNGEHFCLGAHLARLELRVAFREMIQRYSKVELVGDVRRLRSNFINGIKEMPVRFTAR